ncbi:MAG: methionine synthase [Clostridiales bacterium 43-6]|nr:MAG: methionine synthase [Clostridiales bacterium 43-6]
MIRGKITDAVKSGRILVSDGAWGTMLQNKGLTTAECPDEWSVSHFDIVTEIAKDYLDAGADMVETNSFGATAIKLEHYGLSDRAAEINEWAARASRQAAGDDRWVIGSVGPTGKMLLMEEITEEELYEAFKTQAVALQAGGADAVCIETMSDIEEAVIAIQAAKENTDLEIICTFTFDRTVRGDYRTMMGVSPTAAAAAAVQAGADMIGTNCGNGMERMKDIVAEMRKAFPEVPILVHANAGLPVNEDGKVVFPQTPEEMAALTPDVIRAGAGIVGGCCGTTPEHINAIKYAIMNIGR